MTLDDVLDGISFGSENELVDWRAVDKAEQDDDEDEEEPAYLDAVVRILGFDPRQESEAQEQEDEVQT
jgi:hypothetical protein